MSTTQTPCDVPYAAYAYWELINTATPSENTLDEPLDRIVYAIEHDYPVDDLDAMIDGLDDFPEVVNRMTNQNDIYMTILADNLCRLALHRRQLGLFRQHHLCYALQVQNYRMVDYILKHFTPPIRDLRDRVDKRLLGNLIRLGGSECNAITAGVAVRTNNFKLLRYCPPSVLLPYHLNESLHADNREMVDELMNLGCPASFETRVTAIKRNDLTLLKYCEPTNDIRCLDVACERNANLSILSYLVYQHPHPIDMDTILENRAWVTAYMRLGHVFTADDLVRVTDPLIMKILVVQFSLTTKLMLQTVVANNVELIKFLLGQQCPCSNACYLQAKSMYVVRLLCRYQPPSGELVMEFIKRELYDHIDMYLKRSPTLTPTMVKYLVVHDRLYALKRYASFIVWSDELLSYSQTVGSRRCILNLMRKTQSSDDAVPVRSDLYYKYRRIARPRNLRPSAKQVRYYETISTFFQS